MSEPFGVGIVGTGIMGRRMLAALQSHPRFRVVRLWDPDTDALAAALPGSPGAHAAHDLSALVNDPAVDLVYLASPPATHLACVQAALAAGRACLCEKPLAASVDEARAMHDLVVVSGVPFAVHFPFASSPAARDLVELVRGGALGTVRSASITVRFARWPRPWQAGAGDWLAGAAEGGFTREVLSHFVFLAQRLFGPATVAEVYVTRMAGRAEMSLRAQLVHAGVRVAIDGAVEGDVADRNRFEIVGERETVALVDWSRLERGKQVGDRVDATPGTLDRVARMLAGDADHDLATVAEGLQVVRAIEALLVR